MVKNGYITNNEYEKLKNEKISIVNSCNENYFSSYVKAVNTEVENIIKFNPYKHNQTFKINTFLDEKLQKQIYETEILNAPKYSRQQIVINNKNNGIIAFFGENSMLKRSPASCIKPWYIYAPYINEKLITESTVILDEEVTIDNYSPKNYGNNYLGAVTVKTAISKSLNVPSVKLLNSFTLEKANEYSKKFGLDIKNGNLSYALGNINGGMTLKELCDCYSTFSDNGIYTKSAFIDKIYFEAEKYNDRNTLVFVEKNPNNLS
jgi:membrane peptidoglycan carboxypeptidase